jgi:molybdenum cofactor cytidylyltransferase
MATSLAYALVLAAGESSRFDGDKLLAHWNGSPLLGHVLDRVGEAGQRGLIAGAIVVLPPGHRDRESLVISRGIKHVINPEHRSGVGSSLRLGISQLASHYPDSQAALIVQGDQPLLQVDVIGALVATWRTTTRPVIRPRYQDTPATPGHPVLLDRIFWPRVNLLRGNEGCGVILQQSPDLVTIVDVPGRNPDVNTRSDLASLKAPES